MNAVFTFVLVACLPFSLAAAAAAFLIAYKAYSHPLRPKRETFKMALQTALYTLTFFVLLIIVIGFVLSRML
jgi:uncharacterized membrane protein SpoIIM required for sporulation